MTLKIEVLVDQKDLLNGWSEIYLGSDGQPRYRSNSGLVGTGSNVDLLYSAGDYTTPDTSNRTATFTSDGTQNMLLVGVEIF